MDESLHYFLNLTTKKGVVFKSFSFFFQQCKTFYRKRNVEIQQIEIRSMCSWSRNQVPFYLKKSCQFQFLNWDDFWRSLSSVLHISSHDSCNDIGRPLCFDDLHIFNSVAQLPGDVVLRSGEFVGSGTIYKGRITLMAVMMGGNKKMTMAIRAADWEAQMEREREREML